MSEPKTTSTETLVDVADGRAIEVIYDLTRDQLAAQQVHASNLDNKAGVLLTSASLLLAALTLPRTSSPVASNPSVLNAVINAIPFVSIGVYLLLIVTAYQAYALRSYRYPLNPVAMYEQNLLESKEQARDVLTAALVYAFEHNMKVIQRKTRWLRVAFVALAVEAFLIAAILLAAVKR